MVKVPCRHREHHRAQDATGARGVDEGAVSGDPPVDDRKVLWAEFKISFAPDATVGQLNALLAELGGTIVCMTEAVT